MNTLRVINESDIACFSYLDVNVSYGIFWMWLMESDIMSKVVWAVSLAVDMLTKYDATALRRPMDIITAANLTILSTEAEEISTSMNIPFRYGTTIAETDDTTENTIKADRKSLYLLM